MSKLTYTIDDVISEIKFRTGITITHESNPFQGTITFTIPTMKKSTVITTQHWMDYKNQKIFAEGSSGTEDSFNMNLLFTFFVMDNLGLDRHHIKSKQR